MKDLEKRTKDFEKKIFDLMMDAKQPDDVIVYFSAIAGVLATGYKNLDIPKEVALEHFSKVLDAWYKAGGIT